MGTPYPMFVFVIAFSLVKCSLKMHGRNSTSVASPVAVPTRLNQVTKLSFKIERDSFCNFKY